MTRVKIPEHRNYQRVVAAIDFLLERQRQQPSLAEVAEHVGLSEFHLQRVFTEWVGVSPKQFLQFLTKEKAKSILTEQSVFESAIASGLSGSGRLHDLMIRHECVTPGEYKSQGEGLEIGYGVHSCPFGFCFLATTARGICKLSFFDELRQESDLLKELHLNWPRARISKDQQATLPLVQLVFSELMQREPDQKGKQEVIKILLCGTPFRMQVWEALLRIPAGCVVSYQQVANSLGRPTATRAVASAIASNEIGCLIPCHRVIRESGALSEYRWGRGRKAALLGAELITAN